MSTAPLVSILTGWIPAQIAGAAADEAIGRAPYNGQIVGCSIIPEAAVTGATATKRTFTLVNKGQAGVGTTVLATLDLITTVDLVAFDEKDFTLSASPVVNEGDVLAVVEVVAGAGTAHSGGQVSVKIARS